MRRPARPATAPTPDQILEFFLWAYRQGAFPMADVPDTPRRGGRIPTARTVRWYSPEPRAILPLREDGLRIPRTVGRTLRKRRFALTGDRAFERVIRACAEPTPARGAQWLDESLIRCYTALHQAGHAHSVEAWGSQDGGRDASLLGGIYGVSIGAAFFAESMFSAIDSGGSGAANACLISLWGHLRACGYELLDVQIANEHTLRFGVTEIPSSDYMARLESAVAKPDRWRSLPLSS